MPKNLSKYFSLAIPIHPDKILETSILAKNNERLRTRVNELVTRLNDLQETEILIQDLEESKATLLSENTKLTKENEELKTRINERESPYSLQKTEDLIQYLESFKEQFEFHCSIKGHTISILHCANLQSLSPCKFRNKCKGRLALGQKLRYL